MGRLHHHQTPLNITGGTGSPANATGTHITAGNVPFTAADLAHIARLAEAAQFRPVIDRAFDLTDIAQAHRHVSTGRKRGNVVVRVTVPSTRQPSGQTRRRLSILAALKSAVNLYLALTTRS
ncbi:zinc-binding dehydrogenase [Pseudarthrobacter sp. NS4]|uniref:zinc-binding dehydrogenase n=1 Tax=Pseudarthrobacter sp. NS4 TaxID=2973976 RepID=UPI0021618D25|nr:zinc-binding dehydrogenase [Pseudarthrobacter sp. NS4]